MLVVRRKLGQRYLVPDCNLVIAVVAIQERAVRLGIDTPAKAAVVREELDRRRRGPIRESQRT